MIFGAFWPLMILVTVLSFGVGVLLGWIMIIIHGDHLPKINKPKAGEISKIPENCIPIIPNEIESESRAYHDLEIKRLKAAREAFKPVYDKIYKEWCEANKIELPGDYKIEWVTFPELPGIDSMIIKRDDE